MDWLLWGFKVIIFFHFSFFLSLYWVSSSCTSLNGLEYFSLTFFFFSFLISSISIYASTFSFFLLFFNYIRFFSSSLPSSGLSVCIVLLRDVGRM